MSHLLYPPCFLGLLILCCPHSSRHTTLRLRTPKKHLIAFLSIHMWRPMFICRLEIKVSQNQSQHNLNFQSPKLTANAVPRTPLKWPPCTSWYGWKWGLRQETFRNERIRLGKVGRIATHDQWVYPNYPVVGRVFFASRGCDVKVWFADADGVRWRKETEGFFDYGMVVGQTTENIRVVSNHLRCLVPIKTKN